jgi:DNA-3-methyladenine glycosylase I
MVDVMADVYRCQWAANERAIAYHDEEWAVPVHDDTRLFEMLTLEGAQAGLSWDTILRKRERYREVFAGFDVERVAAFGDGDVERLLADAGIVRNRAKVLSTIANAKAILRVRDEFGSFDAFVWRFVGGTPLQPARQSMADVPASTPESNAMSKELKRRGFSFVGTTICYAFMQAVGMVNDHEVRCFRYASLARG